MRYSGNHDHTTASHSNTDAPGIVFSDNGSQTTWLGAENNDWNNPGNWSNGIPSAGKHAYIPSIENGMYPPLIDHLMLINFTLKVDGNLEVADTITISDNGLIQNEGVINIHPVGALINRGKVHNGGVINNRGYIENTGIFSNCGTMQNDGVIDNESTLVNLKHFFNAGTIDAAAGLILESEIENFGQINIFPK